jgi:Ku protein
VLFSVTDEAVMLPRAYWKGSLKLSLVTCPVALYPAATTAERTRFHMINTETGNRLKQQMVDAETGEVVEKDQKGRGYEVAKNKYVPIGKDELDAVRIESSRTLEIDSFVPLGEIDRRYLDRPYYIVPDGKSGADAFAVIRDAMKNKDRAALARVVLTNREYVMAIEPLGKGLVATTLRYADEVRDENDYFEDSRHRRSARTWSNSPSTFSPPRRRISIRPRSRTTTRRRSRRW